MVMMVSLGNAPRAASTTSLGFSLPAARPERYSPNRASRWPRTSLSDHFSWPL